MFQIDENRLVQVTYKMGFDGGKDFAEALLAEQKERIQILENAMLAIMAVVVLPYDERSHEDVRLIATSVLSKEDRPHHKRTLWINMYEIVGTQTSHHSKEEADDERDPVGCIACIKVDLDFVEGEGL